MANVPQVTLNILITDGSTVFQFRAADISFDTFLVNLRFENFPRLDDVEIYRVSYKLSVFFSGVLMLLPQVPPGVQNPKVREKKKTCLELPKLVEEETLQEFASGVKLRTIFKSVEDANEQCDNVHLLLGAYLPLSTFLTNTMSSSRR